jgi:GNAT superfamily N-acetyltransferase
MTLKPFMTVTARLAGSDDLSVLEQMYTRCAAEQVEIRSIWPYADGLPEPISESFGARVAQPDTIVVVGGIDGIPLGFLVGYEEPLLEPKGDRKIGVVHLIFTDLEARGVGIGAAMLQVAIERFRDRGIDLFDALVSPGHRMAKNFFESNGFKARSITMHRAESGSAPTPEESST